MASGDNQGKSITFFIGIANIVLALVWGMLYGSGFLSSQSVLASSSMLFYVLTMFLAGFGIIFPFVERTFSDKPGNQAGLWLSVLAVLLYAAYVGAYVRFGTLQIKALISAIG
ncbi:MAG: hypothetical protein KBG84_01265 [Planctomycetes bacterium]|nr:hypothetical protein [Planctomycetota bacterium]CAG0954307.1 hypothetical protein PLCT2_00376 [Planctomycetaceae bacterium]